MQMTQTAKNKDNDKKFQLLGDIKEMVRNATDVRVLMDVYGVKYKPSAKDTYRSAGGCPIHGGDSAGSFVFDNNSKTYHCFTHKCRGDVFNFVMRLSGCKFHEAIKKVADINGMDISHIDENAIFKVKAGGFVSKIKSLGNQLRQKEIEIRRGLKNAARDVSELDDYMRLPLCSMESRRDIDLEMQNEFDVRLGRMSEDPFRHIRIIIPMHDEHGNYIGQCGRSWQKDLEPKYWYLPVGIKKGMFVFNIHRAKRHVRLYPNDKSTLFVCEGSFDAGKLWRMGYKNAVATFGADMSDTQCDLITTYADRIVICYDDDAAGIRATRKAIPLITTKKSDAEILIFPIEYGKKDIDAMTEDSIQDGMCSLLTPKMWAERIKHRIDLVEVVI